MYQEKQLIYTRGYQASGLKFDTQHPLKLPPRVYHQNRHSYLLITLKNLLINI